jgi:hypothetical protein
VIVTTRCRICGKDLRDPLSRRYGIGPDCRKTMTAAELADALRRNQPGHIPAARPPSAQALANNADARRATEEPEVALCAPHGGVRGSCALCRRDNDPNRAAERIIALIQVRREAERDARYAAWKAAHQPEPEQLTIGATS